MTQLLLLILWNSDESTAYTVCYFYTIYTGCLHVSIKTLSNKNHYKLDFI